MTGIRSGDVVIHVPSDPGRQGSGPYYVDHADYGGDPGRVTVSVFWSYLGWGFGLPWNELKVVGHQEVPSADRMGWAFTPGSLDSMSALTEAGRRRLFALYPAIKARAAAEEAERVADEAATADELTPGRTAAGWNAYAHCLQRGQRIVWTCPRHNAIGSRAVPDCAEQELGRRRAAETRPGSKLRRSRPARKRQATVTSSAGYRYKLTVTFPVRYPPDPALGGQTSRFNYPTRKQRAAAIRQWKRQGCKVTRWPGLRRRQRDRASRGREEGPGAG